MHVGALRVASRALEALEPGHRLRRYTERAAQLQQLRQEIADRAEGARRVVRLTLRRHDARWTKLEVAHELLHQTRLADAGVAPHNRDRRMPLRRATMLRVEPRELLRAPDQRWTRRIGWLHAFRNSASELLRRLA